MASYDVIVVGAGGMGCAALLELARRGARALGVDRFPPGHDRGSSHGQTRIIRQAYFEHVDYVPLLLAAYEKWTQLEDRCGAKLYNEVGLLEIGPPDGLVVPGVLNAARRHGLAVDELTAAEITTRHAGFRVPDSCVGVFEHRAGFLRVEECVRAQAAEAERLGARLEAGVEVRRLNVESPRPSIETDAGRFEADRLIVTAGPWAADLLSDLDLPLQVRRNPMLWYPHSGGVYAAARGCPAFLFELPEGIMYGFPQIDERGVKIAEHTGGHPVDDPLKLDRALGEEDRRPVEDFARRYLPELDVSTPSEHAVCMYTMTPDEHFIIDRHPANPHVALAAGMSGHGFKFAPIVGQAIVDLVLDGRTSLPISFLSLHRPALRASSG